MNRFPLIVLGGIAVGLTGCTMAPKYARPAAPVPAQWPSGAAFSQNQPAAGAPAAADLGWREFVTDEKLRQVIAMALENNRDLRLAALNVEMARALYGIQRNALFPAVTAVGSGAKQRASRDLTEPGKSRITESYSVGVGVLSWEADLFGRMRSLKDSALEQYFSTQQARRGAQTLLVSGVANAYLALAADREGLTLALNTLSAQQESYDLVQRQYQAGIATELDLRQAQIPLETARGDLAKYTRQVAQDENALNLLVGAQVPADLLPGTLDHIAPFREVASQLPSDVLLRRPDVLQAEGLLKAANADIGAARAAFFPNISLTGTVGTASNELSRLFDSGTGTWSFVPSVTMPVFDARTWTAHRASKVQYKMAVVEYERAIQSAFREVADTLAGRGTLKEQLAAQQSLVAALTVTHRLANARFEAGIDSYLGVLDAQRSLFASQQGLILIRLTAVANQVQLYAVLGGGGNDEAASPSKGATVTPIRTAN